MSMLAMLFSVHILSAQTKKDSLKLEVESKKAALSEEHQSEIEKLKKFKDVVVFQEKEKLKEEVKKIEERLAKGELTKEEAEDLKTEAARTAAKNIENRTAILDNKIALAERGENFNERRDLRSTVLIGSKGIELDNEMYTDSTTYRRRIKYDKRTYGSVTVAVGINNAVIEGKGIDGSPYQVGGSKFFEIGYMWNTRLFNNSNAVRFRYGLSLQYNGLRTNSGKYFVEYGDQTILEEFPYDLKKAKLRMDNIVAPVFFEFGPSKKVERDRYFRYYNSRMFKIGIGGYAGLNYSTRQKLKYKKDGDKSKDKLKTDYNTNNFIYGVAAYVGIGDASLYVKYDLNPIFHNAETKQNNVSLGIRWDLD
ncbi:hypothetical protein NBRC110019_01830 [Neptunitalea chrysea]|uniref:Outer membrane protein beta-barrel domain-containing protein n=2 Tax=Neptunitalea chrysea TaxID=1647581 RepID=A0A9W6B2N6_9FLAO|nr:hypothetical protein NBRC110019_01830 [Neptunitalea chrysea]